MTPLRKPMPYVWACGLALWALTACQAPAGPAPHADLVRDQLAEVVGQQTPHCGAVLEYLRHGRRDYRVECASGQVYRVRVSADGRVVVKPYEAAASAPQ
jgi:hypothetical protein